jgi:hypothetical protein
MIIVIDKKGTKTSTCSHLVVKTVYNLSVGYVDEKIAVKEVSEIVPPRERWRLLLIRRLAKL